MKLLIITIWLLSFVSIFCQTGGDLRFNPNKQRSEIYIDSEWEETEVSTFNNIPGYKVHKYQIKGWYGIDSLYAEHGDYFHIGWNTYDLGYLIGMRKIFNVLLEEKLFNDYYYFYINGRHDNR